jgi:hypothetical protein
MGRFPTRKRFTFLITLFVLSTMFSSAQKVSLNFSGQNLRTVLESITEQTEDLNCRVIREVLGLN